MACSVCGRGGCVASFHPISEQEDAEKSNADLIAERDEALSKCDDLRSESDRLRAALYQCTGVMAPDHPDPHHRHALAGALAALRGEDGE